MKTPRQTIKNLSGLIFVFCVAFIPLRTVEDACPYNGGRVAEDVDPYKIILNIFMRSSLSQVLFLFCIYIAYP